MIPLRYGKVESSTNVLVWRDAMGLGTPERVTRTREGLGRIPVKLRHRGTVVTAAYPGLIR